MLATLRKYILNERPKVMFVILRCYEHGPGTLDHSSFYMDICLLTRHARVVIALNICWYGMLIYLAASEKWRIIDESFLKTFQAYFDLCFPSSSWIPSNCATDLNLIYISKIALHPFTEGTPLEIFFRVVLISL
jgi:hypothetical protein